MVHVAHRGGGVDDLAEILAALAEVLPSAEVAACDPLDTLADLGVDSLTLVQFVATLERRFAVELTDSDLESLGTATLRDVCRLVREADGSRDGSSGAPAETAHTERHPNVTVRGYRDTDKEALTRICIEGSSWGALRDLAPMFFLDAYLAEPASCFVAELEGRIVGYWVGTLDVRKLQRDTRRRVAAAWPAILAWYWQSRSRLSRSERSRYWRQILVGRNPSRRRLAFILQQVGETFGKTYVHFQVDKEAAPAGTVFSLARAWIDHLRRRRVQGALLPSVPGGPGAIEMWKRLGFAPVEIPHPDGTRRTWLLAVL